MTTSFLKSRLKFLRFVIFMFLIILFSSFASSSRAQQTIFNVPSTDILEKGRVYAEIDFSFKPNEQRDVNKFSSFVPRIVVGVGENVEVGLNVTGNINPGIDSTTLVPTVKWRFYQNEKKKISLVAGTNVFIPLRNRAYGVGSYSYVEGSKTINKTRLTAGGYFYSKNIAASKSRGGAQFGFEQTVNSKFIVAADYLSGKHANGYLTPGVFYKPTLKTTGYFGYSIGNAGVRGGNHFFLFELGYNFN